MITGIFLVHRNQRLFLKILYTSFPIVIGLPIPRCSLISHMNILAVVTHKSGTQTHISPYQTKIFFLSIPPVHSFSSSVIVTLLIFLQYIFHFGCLQIINIPLYDMNIRKICHYFFLII